MNRNRFKRLSHKKHQQTCVDKVRLNQQFKKRKSHPNANGKNNNVAIIRTLLRYVPTVLTSIPAFFYFFYPFLLFPTLHKQNPYFYFFALNAI